MSQVAITSDSNLEYTQNVTPQVACDTEGRIHRHIKASLYNLDGTCLIYFVIT
jgi:hypothetical protein